MTLTDEQREWRKDMQRALEKLEQSIIEINGPYQPTRVALAVLKAASEIAIDDEGMGPCGSCGEPIWMLADGEYVATDDGERFCPACVARWNEPAATAKATA